MMPFRSLHRFVLLARALMRSRGPLVARFARAERGVALLEFALISPFLITLLLGSFEVTRYVNTTRRLTYLSSSIAEILAQNTTGLVDYTDILSALDSTLVTFPNVLGDAHNQGILWYKDIKIAMSSVAFTPTVANCTSGCTYTAAVVWNYGAVNGATSRPCGTPLTPASDTATPTSTTLPTDIYGPGSLIVVDVVYTYRPLVATKVFGAIAGPMQIARSFYIQPRYVSLIKYNTWSDPGIATECPGY